MQRLVYGEPLDMNDYPYKPNPAISSSDIPVDIRRNTTYSSLLAGSALNSGVDRTE